MTPASNPPASKPPASKPPASKPPASKPYEVLLLDFGGVCLKTPFELHQRLEQRLGLPAGSASWRGPFAPETDELWTELLLGDVLQERLYWERRAQDVAELIGRPFSLRDYMTTLFEPPGPDLTRPEATATINLALGAGIRVAVLTNDLKAFHGPEWSAAIPMLDLVERIIDCSDTGVLKPEPAAYRRAARELDVDESQILFVDDQTLNVRGARSCGLATIQFDVSNAAASWAEVQVELGVEQ
jgi:putative hydrolase of the HAD superfamily